MSEAAKTIAALIERLQKEPADTEVEFVVATSAGKLITARLTANNAKAIRIMLRHMEP